MDADGTVWVRARGRAEDFGAFDSQPLPPPPEGYRTPDDRPAWWERSALEGRHVVLGTSVEGRPIDAVWFGAPPHSGMPVLRVLAGHHGDEGSAWELALDLVDRFADEGGALGLADRTVWVVPFVNPDGAQAHTRRNARTVDLNRNYDLQWVEGLDTGPAPWSEPETRAIAAWGDLVRPVWSMSMHSGAENLGWVWNYTEEPALDAAGLEALAMRYRDALGQPDFWLTNGAAWYVTRGDTNDWSYGRFGSWDYTLELTNLKSPPVEALDEALGPHEQALWDLLRAPLYPVRAVDADTGHPVAARFVLDDGQPRWTDPVDGVSGSVAPWGEGVAWAPGYDPAVVDADGVARLSRRGLEEGSVRRGIVGAPCPELPGPGPWVLHRAGYQVDIERGDPLPMAGVWWVEASDGAVAPHGLVVGDRRWSGQEEGWAYGGGATFLRPVDSIADGDVLWSNGEWLVVGDLSPTEPVAVESTFVARGASCATQPISGHLWFVVLSIIAGRTRRTV